MHRSCSPTILSISARVSASAWSRASCGLLRTRSSVCRQARAASPNWRSQRCSASRWRRAARRCSACARWRRHGRRRSTTSSSTGSARATGVDGVGVAAGRSRWRRRRAGQRPRPRRSSRGRGVDCAEVALLRAPAHACAGRASGSSPAAPRVVMRKLLSGNGCDIQPTSRWTNMPTRSAWTSISSVGRGFFMECRGARGHAGIAKLSAAPGRACPRDPCRIARLAGRGRRLEHLEEAHHDRARPAHADADEDALADPGERLRARTRSAAGSGSRPRPDRPARRAPGAPSPPALRCGSASLWT